MKKWDVKKLVTATVIFLLVSIASAPLPGQAVTVEETVKFTQEAVAKTAIKAPLVNLRAPKMVKMDNLGDDQVRGSRVFIREVDASYKVMNALMLMPLSFDKARVASTEDSYGSEEGAYVNLGPTNLMTGMLNVDRIDPSVAHRVDAIVKSPEKFGVDPIKLNLQVTPKVIEVATVNIKNEMSKHQVLAMESWDFRLSDISRYDKASLKHLLNRAYSTFKSYCDVMHRRVPGSALEIHTGFWGVGEEGNNARVTTVLQMMAAQLAGVDHLTFHYAGENPQAIEDAQDFLDARSGMNVSEILDDLLSKTSQSGWRPG